MGLAGPRGGEQRGTSGVRLAGAWVPPLHGLPARGEGRGRGRRPGRAWEGAGRVCGKFEAGRDSGTGMEALGGRRAGLVGVGVGAFSWEADRSERAMEG